MTRIEHMASALCTMRLAGLKMPYGTVPADAKEAAAQINAYLAMLPADLPDDVIADAAQKAIKMRDSYPDVREFKELAMSAWDERFILVLHPSLDLCVRIPKGLSADQITKRVLEAGREHEKAFGLPPQLEPRKSHAKRPTLAKIAREKSMPPEPVITDEDLKRRDDLIKSLRKSEA